MPTVSAAQNRPIPLEPVQPPAHVAAAGAAAQAAMNDDPPPYPQADTVHRRVVGNDDITMYAVLLATGTCVNIPTEDEVRRAYAMASAHNTTARKMSELIIDLSTPVDAPGRPRIMPGAERRLALGALMGIRIGFAPDHAQQIVDKARNKPETAVAMFLAEELAVGAGVALSVYGAYLIRGKAVAGVTAKAAALKAGGLGVAGTAQAGAVCRGWVDVGLLAGIWAVGSVLHGGATAVGVARNFGDVLEPKWFQDRRILEGILQGEVVTTHPARAARARRPQ